MNPTSPWQINDFECFEAPGVTALFYHNHYEEGKQGGFELIQQGQRIVGNGNLRLESAPGQWALQPKNGKRTVDGSALKISCEFPDIRYHVRLTAEGRALRLNIDLDEALPKDYVGKAGFNLELAPNTYLGKAYLMDDIQSGVFPHQFDGPVQGNDLTATELARGRRLIIAPESPSARLEIVSLDGELSLCDGRAKAQNGWFVVRGLIPARKATGALTWIITPTLDSEWHPTPAILYSQIGYHPRDRKQAAIELGPLPLSRLKEARLVKITSQGESIAKKQRLKRWGSYLANHYAIFDFSQITETGLYRLEYGDQISHVFRIAEDIYQQGVWQPTLETFFPVQMCHVEVRDGYRKWHGACHLDDAIQAPVNHKHFDGYAQGPDTETPYKPGDHIPYLDRGGWHDAGDYDLAAGSQARTTLILAHIREAFNLNSDQTTVDRTNRRVDLHTPSGVPDIIEQVTHGVENLLGSYRMCKAAGIEGHSISGIIAGDIAQYVHLGDASLMTDNVISADDRWAFTNRDTALEYLVCGSLAAASRVLHGWENELADECLKTAVEIWACEQGQKPKTARSSYVPGWPEIQAILAAVELLQTTKEDVYRQHVINTADQIVQAVPFIGGVIAPALELINDTGFRENFRIAAEEYIAELRQQAKQTPFHVPYTDETWREQHPVWGVGWNLLSRAVNLYPLFTTFPELATPDLITGVLGYNFGCHPCSNKSLVSGVGPDSLTIAYGVNRAEWSYTPGGVVSGPSLIRPNFAELQDPFPWLWQQKEYVISGAASYIYCVLAADELLNKS